jgi:amidase
MNTSDLVYQDAHILAEQIRTKQLSSYELVQAYLQRINNHNPQINAIIAMLDEQEILQMAKDADEVLAKGQPIGPLHGLPIALKEMVQAKGWRSTFCWAAGVREPKLDFLGFNHIQQEDSILAERIKSSGLMVIGKTNMPPFAFGSHTRNELFGITRNPYNPGKTVGGSSGGATAALAAGFLPLADGSDLGGSLRNPAAFCNVIGFRPSIGRVPKSGSGWIARVATEGPMARSVKDIALFLSTIAGPSTADPLSIQESSTQFLNTLQKDFKGIKVGWTADYGNLPVEKEVVETCHKALDKFKDLGIEVTDQSPTLMEKAPVNAMDVFRTLRVMALAEHTQIFHKTLGEEGIRKYLPANVQHQFLVEHQKVDAAKIYEAEINRVRLYNLCLQFFEDHDFLISPSTQVLPFDVEKDYVRSINGQSMNDYLEWMSISCILSITGCPVISMPCGFSENGLPVGIQIMGKPNADFEVLQFAYAFEQASQVSAKYKKPSL